MAALAGATLPAASAEVEASVRHLTVRELKLYLDKYHVNYSNFVEKREFEQCALLIEGALASLQRKKYVLSHTWWAPGQADLEEEHEHSKLRFLRGWLSAHSPPLSLDEVFIDWLDIPKGATHFLGKIMNDLYSRLPMIVLPSHPHYGTRGWCLVEMLMNMLSGHTPLVPKDFQLQVRPIEELIISEALVPALHPLARITVLWSRAKITEGKDATLLFDLIVRSIREASVPDMKHALHWQMRNELEWVIPENPDYSDAAHAKADSFTDRDELWQLVGQRLEETFTYDVATQEEYDQGTKFKCVACDEDKWLVKELTGQKICIPCTIALVTTPARVMQNPPQRLVARFEEEDAAACCARATQRSG